MGFFLLFFSLVSFLGTPLSRHGAHCAAGPRVGALERRLAEAGRGGHRPVPVVAVTLQPQNLRGGLRTFLANYTLRYRSLGAQYRFDAPIPLRSLFSLSLFRFFFYPDAHPDCWREALDRISLLFVVCPPFFFHWTMSRPLLFQKDERHQERAQFQDQSFCYTAVLVDAFFYLSSPRRINGGRESESEGRATLASECVHIFFRNKISIFLPQNVLLRAALQTWLWLVQKLSTHYHRSDGKRFHLMTSAW